MVELGRYCINIYYSMSEAIKCKSNFLKFYFTYAIYFNVITRWFKTCFTTVYLVSWIPLITSFKLTNDRNNKTILLMRE